MFTKYGLIIFSILLFTKSVLPQSYSQVTHVLRNSFSGGSMIIDGNTVDVPTTSSGFGVGYVIGCGPNEYYTQYYGEAINNQFIEDYTRAFQNWTLNAQSYSSNLRHYFLGHTGSSWDIYTVTHVANFLKLCNVSYSTQVGGVTQSWPVTVNGSSYPSPTSNFPIIEQNAITANVTQHYDLGGNVWYWFDKWSDNVVQLERTDNPTTHKNLTAIYKTVPVFTEGRYRNLVITGTVRPGVGNIKLMWSEHPNTSVTQYQVWRRIKYINGVPQSLTPVLIATVNRGTTQYIDYNFTYTPTDLSTVLEYDVKAYYAPEGTTSQDDWESVSAYDASVNKSSVEPEITKITEYKVMNYPNPFNPTTTINYQLPEPGFVTLKVYDMLGKEVAVLVNEYKDQGSYNEEFEGGSLSSGLYFYELRSNNYVSVKKMLLLR